MPNGLRSSSMAQETPGSKRSALDFILDAHTEFRQLEQSIQKAEADGDDLGLAELFGKLEEIDGEIFLEHGLRDLSPPAHRRGHQPSATILSMMRCVNSIS